MQASSILDERIIWLVPFMFYIFDNLCLIDDEHIIILENYRFHWAFQLASVPFVFRKRHLYLLPILLPYVFAYRFRWRAGRLSNKFKAARLHKRLSIWRSKCNDFRALAVLAWFNLFVVGPALTAVGGFMFALKYALPFHVVVLCSCISLIILNSQLLKLNRRAVITQIFELTVSPGYLPNVCRRLSLDFDCEDVDGVLFIKRFGDQSTAEKLINAVEFRLSEMKIENGDNPEYLRGLEEYAAEIRR